MCYCFQVKKHISKLALSFATFLFVFLLFTPYFTTDFMDLRQQKENEENYQRFLQEKIAQEIAKRNAEDKIYLTGKFDPNLREDFALVPSQYNIARYKMYLRKETLDAFGDMAEAAAKDSIELNITSATRNFDYQKDLWNRKWDSTTLAEKKDLSEDMLDEIKRFKKILEYSAAPGTSRHHWGTEIDINSVTPKFFETSEGKKVYEWLQVNAPVFGFCQTYNEKGESRQAGYNEEKWHWSYMPLSRTLTQEYKKLIKDEDITGFLGDQYVPALNLINNYVLNINPDCF
ncbi:hypothetical protein A2917_01360 [Candidatus Nomurabacteria bacterium RIFCSPLOWO2_01_FULL_42_17]|uniref:D-alanyl-D-alanine carboxypeptidase-like core domain-containing protein n=1 Tax=Candidatus Nomurabacteria bacterium RIFCSPLOWO2_01_FULL_42_17 TaxID=1801780 RepID=A0A1F6XLR3_9BACT|nr:MAG: hypothetical protein A2917_01360 [Candidatus Nomurabacteria bacterium RIFCSPLOWO2_01_FULL_42_17]